MPVDELNAHVIDWQISTTHIIATFGNINTPEVVKTNVFMNALELVVPEGAPDTEDEEDDTGPRPGDKRKASAGPRHVIRAGDGIRLDTLPGVTKNKSDRCEYKAHDNLQNFNESYPDLMKAHFLELCRRCFDVVENRQEPQSPNDHSPEPPPEKPKTRSWNELLGSYAAAAGAAAFGLKNDSVSESESDNTSEDGSSDVSSESISDTKSCFGSTLWRATICNDTESIVGALKEGIMFKKRTLSSYLPEKDQKYFSGISVKNPNFAYSGIIFRQDDTQDWEVLERKDIMIHFKMNPGDTIIGRSQSMLYDAVTAVATAIDREIKKELTHAKTELATVTLDAKELPPPSGWRGWLLWLFSTNPNESEPEPLPSNTTHLTPILNIDTMGNPDRIWNHITSNSIRNPSNAGEGTPIDATTYPNIPPVTNEDLEALKHQLTNNRSHYEDGTKWSAVVSPNSIMTEVSKLGLLTPTELKQVVYVCFKGVLDPRSSLDLEETSLVEYADLIEAEITDKINPARKRVQAEWDRKRLTDTSVVYRETVMIDIEALNIHVDGFHYGDHEGKTCGGALYKQDPKKDAFSINTYSVCKIQLDEHKFIDVTNSDFYRMLVPSHDKNRKEDTADMLSPCYATITGPSDTNIPTVCVIENYFRHTDDFLVTESCAMAMLSRVKGGVKAKRVLQYFIYRHNAEEVKSLSKNAAYNHLHQREAAAFFIACGRAITKLSGDYTRWKSSTKVEKDAMEQLKYDTMCTFVLGTIDLTI